jgi:hypothetical protein
MIHTVRNINKEVCGHIVYLERQDAGYSSEWIQEAKDLMRASGAGMAVIVAGGLPDGAEIPAAIEGVLVCRGSDVKYMISALRETILRGYAILQKKTDLGSYFSGSGFKESMESLINGFRAMKEQTDKERYAMQSIWAQRAKQIEMILESTINMYGSIKGIGGEGVCDIPSLEIDAAAEKK